MASRSAGTCGRPAPRSTDDRHGRAERPAGVAGGGLDPEVVDDVLAEEPAVGHAVEGDAAGQAEGALAGGRPSGAGQADHDVLGHGLDRRGEVEMVVEQRRFGRATGDAEEPLEGRPGHLPAGEELEVVECRRNEPSGLMSISSRRMRSA